MMATEDKAEQRARHMRNQPQVGCASEDINAKMHRYRFNRKEFAVTMGHIYSER